ncbi:MAG: hypothetical protein AAGB31_01400 [Bdellovibrio sp.]
MEKFILNIPFQRIRNNGFFSGVLLLSWALVLISCSGQVEKTSGIDSNTVITGSFQTYDETTIEGSGTLRFMESLSVLTSRAFVLKASLDSTIAMSSVTVNMYSSSATVALTNGVAVTFTRSGASVVAEVSINGNTATVNSTRMAYYYPTNLDVIIEVHNVNTKARVLVWRRDLIEYSVLTADIDTDRSGDLLSSLPTQRGQGPYVGLILNNATVTTARLESQRVLD